MVRGDGSWDDTGVLVVPQITNEVSQLSATGASHGGVVAGVAAVQYSSHEVLTQQEVAAWLKVRPRQLDRMGVPRLDLGHKTKRYFAKDVQAWLESQRRIAS